MRVQKVSRQERKCGIFPDPVECMVCETVIVRAKREGARSRGPVRAGTRCPPTYLAGKDRVHILNLYSSPLLGHESLGAWGSGKVHGTTNVTFVVFEGHVLGQDASDLFSHTFSSPVVMPVTNATEGSNNQKNAGCKCTSGYGTRWTGGAPVASFALSTACDARSGIQACGTLFANLGSSSSSISRANSMEDAVG